MKAPKFMRTLNYINFSYIIKPKLNRPYLKLLKKNELKTNYKKYLNLKENQLPKMIYFLLFKLVLNSLN